MVTSDVEAMRLDVDNHILTKTVDYYTYTYVEDTMYGSRTKTPVSYKIKCQITIQAINTKYSRQGRLAMGDAIAVFRYEYNEESDGSVINPALVVSEQDEVKYLTRKYRIKKVIPVVRETDDIIAWEAHLVDTTTDKDKAN